jgi:hypothetical protein
MSIGTIVATTLASAFFFSATVGGLAADSKCGSFRLTGGKKAINVVDNPPKGPSLGDVRVGNRQLLDKDANRVADVNFSATLTALPTASTGSVFSSIYFIKFVDGWISFTSLYELSDATDTSQRAGTAILLVAGGTGAFENARGKIEIEAGDPPAYVFDLSCE